MSDDSIELNDHEFNALRRGDEVVCEIPPCPFCEDGTPDAPDSRQVTVRRTTRPRTDGGVNSPRESARVAGAAMSRCLRFGRFERMDRHSRALEHLLALEREGER